MTTEELEAPPQRDARIAHERIGVALFDDPTQIRMKDGWASCAGGRAFRLADTGELDSDVLWVTNLTSIDMQQLNVSENSKLRRSDFLKQDLRTIAWEMGISVGDDPVKAVEVLSEVSNRVCALARSHYKFLNYSTSLHTSVRKYMNEGEKPTVLDKNVGHALRQAFQQFQKGIGRIPDGYETVTLRFPRDQYAKWMMNVPVPAGEWTPWERDLPKDYEAQQRMCFDIGTYASGVFKIAIKNTPRYSDLLDHGNGRNVRNWVMLPELTWLLDYCDVEIQAAYTSAGYAIPDAKPRWKLPSISPVRGVSVSAGLLLENHWRALASEEWRKADEEWVRVPNAISATLSAWDRLYCFESAKRFVDGGIQVRSYGNGSVTIVVPRDKRDLKHALELADDRGLVPAVGQLISLKDVIPEIAEGIAP